LYQFGAVVNPVLFTGMVACALITNIVLRSPAILQKSQAYAEDIESGFYMATAWDDREVDPLLEGEYKLILQLVSVLQFGREAKGEFMTSNYLLYSC
jgi:hypothetical protein